MWKIFSKMKMFVLSENVCENANVRNISHLCKKWRGPFFKTLLSVLLWPNFFVQKQVPVTWYRGGTIGMDETKKSFKNEEIQFFPWQTHTFKTFYYSILYKLNIYC